MALKFFAYGCHCSVDTELIDRKNDAINCINCVHICSEVYRQFSMSFALENASGQRSLARKVGCPLSANSNNICSAMSSQAPCGLFSEEYHFFSEPGPIKDRCPIPNILASTFTVSAFANHSSLLPYRRCH